MAEALGFNLVEFIFAVVNFFLLVGILAKFLYKPFLAMLENRKQAIKDSFDNAADINRRADEKMSNYEKRIARAEDESREIIRSAKQRAEAQASDIIEEAHEKVVAMKVQAEKEIEREKLKALSEMKSQVAMLALLAAEKILEKNFEVEGQDQLIDNIIEQAGVSRWQN